MHSQIEDYLKGKSLLITGASGYLASNLANSLELKNTELISKRVFSLPIYPELTKSDQSQVISNLKNFLQP